MTKKTLKNKNNNNHRHKKAWLISVDMGYGHQRAAYPLRELAFRGKLINANNYRGIPKEDRETWRKSRKLYEFISRFKKIPLIGEPAFKFFDKWQSIPDFYPKRDLSDPTFALEQMVKLIKKRDWGKHLINKLARVDRPLVTTFFIPAFMAEYFKYPGEIYCLATDTDISRSWVNIHPNTSRINYLAPSYRVQQRLKLYGIREENIFLTGFPLPKENLGKDLKIAKADLGKRLINLDPKRRYLKQYYETVKEVLGKNFSKSRKPKPITVMFAVGGAGAQRELGITIAKSLKTKILKKQARLILVAGIHNDVSKYFKDNLAEIGLGMEIDKGVKVIYAYNKYDYFAKFNKALRDTDIIWSKPSELSFYVGLGMPMIMSDPIGSQEKFNRKWLLTLGAGVRQEDPRYTHQWLFDWLDSGWFAEAAMQGFLEAPKHGTENIEKIVGHEYEEARVIKTILQY